MTTKNTFDTSSLFPDIGIPNTKFDATSTGLGAVLQYENMDNTVTPGRGIRAELTATNYGQTWGGDDEYNKYRAVTNFWVPASKDWIWGFRIDAEAISGSQAPFYEHPFISMRGIPMMRYQGEETLVGETEVRWDFTPRWSAIGFVGIGAAYSDRGAGEDQTVLSKGFGFRYLMALRFGMRAGIDLAWGPEDFAWYLQVGYAWSR